MIVADASALIDLLLDRAGAVATIEAIGERRAIHVPHLAETEVLHALRRWVAGRQLEVERAEGALEDLGELPVVYHAHSPLRERVWALRDRLTAYDATYVALAEALDATLVTADGRLARAAGELVPMIEAS